MGEIKDRGSSGQGGVNGQAGAEQDVEPGCIYLKSRALKAQACARWRHLGSSEQILMPKRLFSKEGMQKVNRYRKTKMLNVTNHQRNANQNHKDQQILVSVRMGLSKKTKDHKRGREHRHIGTPCTVGGNAKRGSHCGKHQK